MYFRTGNACLLAIFSEPIDEVAELLNREAPTEYPGWCPLTLEPGRPRWTAHLAEAGEWVDVYPGGPDWPFTRVVFDSSEKHHEKLERLFHAMLGWPLKPREMLLGDEDCHGPAFEIYESCKGQVTVDAYLEPIEGNHSAWGTHSEPSESRQSTNRNLGVRPRVSEVLNGLRLTTIIFSTLIGKTS